MICLLVCLFLSRRIQCYSIKEINPGDSQTSLDLLFQGNVDISYYDVATSTICSMPLEKIDHPSLPLFKKNIAISNTPNDYLISQAYRIDYYLNPTPTNNPNTLNANYVLDCKGDDPYKCSPVTSKSITCIFGLRMATYSAISLKSQLIIDFGFSIEFSFLMNSKDELIALFHTRNINTLLNDFTSNGNDVSFALNSFYLKAVIGNDNQLALFLNVVSNTGALSQLISAKQTVSQSSLNQLHFKLEYDQKGLEECLSHNNVIIKRRGIDTTYFQRVSVNHQIIACLCLDIMTIVTSNTISISFIGKSQVNLLLLTSLFTQFSNSHCSIANKPIECGFNSMGSTRKVIKVQNISQYNGYAISVVYSKSNDFLLFCQNSDGLVLIDSSYNLGLDTCTYTVEFSPDNLKGLFIKNEQIKVALGILYPVKLSSLFSPSSLYNLCVNSKNLVLEVGYCSCKICLKTIEITSTYHQVNQCLREFNEKCNCFDQSQVTPSSPFSFAIISINLCSECYIDDNCSSNNKNGKCANALQSKATSVIHNDRTILWSNSKYLNQHIVYGQCDCGVMASYATLNRVVHSYSVYYDVNSHLVLSQDMITCIECLYETNAINSGSCMRNCQRFQVDGVEPYHAPFGGFQCTSCVFSSEFLQVINKIEPNNSLKLKECIEEYPETFYSSCMTLIKDLKYPSNQVFSGVLTHFRVECPGRPFDDEGSVCIPWFGFNAISFFTLIYKKTANHVQWEDKYQCLNSQCEPSPKANCPGSSCVCYDSCPISKGKFFNQIPIPCSGNGVCTNQSKCICDPGFIEPTCETHCSDTLGGCCLDTSDCLHNASLPLCIKNLKGNVGYCSN